MGNPLRLPMAVQALKGLFSPPATRRYPSEARPAIPGARGRLTIDLSTCVYCRICERRCPCGALTCSREEKSLVVDDLRCTACGVCVDACNKDSLALVEGPIPVQRTRHPAKKAEPAT